MSECLHYKRITHIWFSHEHPDHFFPPNLKSIPLEYRKNITILYHQTTDKKVVDFCKKLEFKEVVELMPNTEYKLGLDFTIINTPFGHDSWLYIKTDKCSILNTNDCVINTREKAEKILTTVGEIDVLLTQFSYASKHGNPNQPEKRRKAVADKYAQISLQIEVFKPKYLIPIASFVWYSHEENFYMNDEMNKIDKVQKFISRNGVTPVILYPGETYFINDEHDNESSIKNYIKDYENINIDKTTKTKSITLESIKESADELIKQLKKEDLLSFALIGLMPIKIYLPDLERAVKFSALSGLKEIKSKREETNIIMTSEVLDYCLKFNWGFGATNVNGRFQTNQDKDLVLFNYYVSITDSLNHKDSTLKRVSKKAIRKVKSLYYVLAKTLSDRSEVSEKGSK